MQLLEMIWTFFKVGICTFGGGYAMLPVIEREVVDRKKWATQEEILDYYAVGQCTPGVIAVNTATFVGYKHAGALGGVLCSLGFVLPSLLIILCIAAVLSNFAELAAVKNAFAGIRVCVCVLILNSVVKLWKSAVKDRLTLCVFLLVFAAMAAAKYGFGVNLSPVLFVLLSAVGGLVLNALGKELK